LALCVQLYILLIDVKTLLKYISMSLDVVRLFIATIFADFLRGLYLRCLVLSIGCWRVDCYVLLTAELRHKNGEILHTAYQATSRRILPSVWKLSAGTVPR